MRWVRKKKGGGRVGGREKKCMKALAAEPDDPSLGPI